MAHFTKRSFRTTYETTIALPGTDLVTHAHQQLSKLLMLVGWEDEDACEIVRIPGEFLFREEAQDVVILGVIGIGEDEEVVEKGDDIVEDGLVIEEEFGEQGKVLCV